MVLGTLGIAVPGWPKLFLGVYLCWTEKILQPSWDGTQWVLKLSLAITSD